MILPLILCPQISSSNTTILWLLILLNVTEVHSEPTSLLEQKKDVMYSKYLKLATFVLFLLAFSTMTFIPILQVFVDNIDFLKELEE
jgi:hypothetical protein